MALVSKATVKLLWGIADADTSQDTLIDLYIAQCGARIRTFVGRSIEAASFTEYYQGTGTRILTLRNRPINSVASIYEDANGQSGQSADPFPASTLLVATTDYEIVKDGDGGAASSGMIRRLGTVWRKPDAYQWGVISSVPADTGGTIKITYNAGFATVPEDIQQACVLLMAATKRIIKIGAPTQSEGWESYNYSLAQAAGEAFGGLPSDVLAALIRYRNVALG